MEEQRVYGLIGYPLSHSFSPGYFNRKFEQMGINAVYKLFPITGIAAITDVIKKNDRLAGLNVTIPYKESVLGFLDEVDRTAQTLGAVNCISIKSGKTTGYNTDVIGFENSLRPLLAPYHKHALVMGTGGASKAVIYVLRKLGIAVNIVSRDPGNGELGYSSITRQIMEQNTLIVNTTPLGMHPDEEAFPPLPYEFLGASHLLYDLIYNPALTKFLSLGEARGATIKNGLEMLELQAEASWEIWNR